MHVFWLIENQTQLLEFRNETGIACVLLFHTTPTCALYSLHRMTINVRFICYKLLASLAIFRVREVRDSFFGVKYLNTHRANQGLYNDVRFASSKTVWVVCSFILSHLFQCASLIFHNILFQPLFPGGSLFGLLGKSTNRHGRDLIVCLSYTVHIICFYLIFINMPDHSPRHCTNEDTYITSKWVLLHLQLLHKWHGRKRSIMI